MPRDYKFPKAFSVILLLYTSFSGMSFQTPNNTKWFIPSVSRDWNHTSSIFLTSMALLWNLTILSTGEKKKKTPEGFAAPQSYPKTVFYPSLWLLTRPGMNRKPREDLYNSSGIISLPATSATLLRKHWWHFQTREAITSKEYISLDVWRLMV